MYENDVYAIMEKVTDKLNDERLLLIYEIKRNDGQLGEWYFERRAAIEAYENVLRWFYESVKK